MRVLRTRGTCAGCRYSLVGLPLSDSSAITCPECGLETEVDSSLAELTRRDDEESGFVPGVLPAPPPGLLTPERLRRIKRAGLRIVLIVVLALAAVGVGYELFLRHPYPVPPGLGGHLL